MVTKIKIRSAFILCWGLLSHVPGACSESTPSANPRYVLLETEDAFIYMDDEGVAVRAEKNWACRNVGWASTAEPKIFSNSEFPRFRQGQIDGGAWNQWLCRAVVGPVVYSRKLQTAQRAMNAAPLRPRGAPNVPETGRINWQMFDYSRIGFAERIRAARRTHFEQLAASYLDFIHPPVDATRLLLEPETVVRELSILARSRLLNRLDPICGRVVSTVEDAVRCWHAERKSLLQEAESAYSEFANLVIPAIGRVSVPAEEARAMGASASRVESRLARFEAASLGLSIPENASERPQ